MQERIALALASLVLVTGVVVFTLDVGDDDVPLAVATTAPATLSPVLASPPLVASPKPASPAPASVTAVPAPASAALAAATPPKPGTYRYREMGRDGTTEETLRITDKGAGRQTEEDGDATSEVAWRDDGKFVLETTFSDEQSGFRCDWEPDVLEYKLPLASGSTWHVENSCAVGQGFSVEIDATSRVTGSERTTVAGQTIDTWVIHSEGTLTFRSPQGAARENVSADDRFSPAHGLSVRLTETVNGPDPATGENVTRSSTRELLGLTPQ